MAFFDDLSKKIGSAADKAADKAKDMAEIGKLSLSISAQEKQLADLYAKIGQAVFAASKDDPASPYAQDFVKIQSVLDTLSLLNSQLAAVRANKNDVIDIEPTAEAESTDQPHSNTCPICGALVDAGGKFCSSCGAML